MPRLASEGDPGSCLPAEFPDETVAPGGLQPTRALLRGLHVLEAVGSNPGGLSLAETASRAKLDKATTHRMLYTLTMTGYIRHDPSSGNYRLTSRLMELSRKGHDHSELVGRSRAELEWLVNQTQETVNLGVFDVDHVSYIDQIESPQSVRLVSAVGRELPVHTTAIGKAILGAMDEPDRQRALRSINLTAMGPRSIRTMDAFLDELAKTRKRGYAIDNQENEEGVICVGAAIVDDSHIVAGGVSVSGPAFRMSPRLSTISRDLRQAIERIQRR
jgi:DNA-binding IclR family transcriptional regulator